jgi:hypothetical protein
MGDWEVVSNSGQQMILERGLVRKELPCPRNRIGSRTFKTASPGQLIEDTTIRLLLTDTKSEGGMPQNGRLAASAETPVAFLKSL